MEEDKKQLEEVMAHDAVGAENGGSEKRERKEEDGEGEGDAKKPKLEESSLAEDRIENLEAKEEGGEDLHEEVMEEAAGKEEASVEEAETAAAHLGPKAFCSSVEMFDYFYKLLHHWPPNLDINKYEHIVLLELLKKGHADAAKKIGEGIQAFQVRYHPAWKSKCFFLLRIDGSMDDFSFRKCVYHILPLPDNMKMTSPSNSNKARGKQKGGGGGHGHERGERGRGRGGRGRGNIGR